jgi:hypothetical protein
MQCGLYHCEGDMRFFLLVTAAAACGAGAVFGVPRLFPEQIIALKAATRSASVAMSQYSLADLNPLRLSYDHVQREVTSPTRKLDFPIGNPVVVDQSKMFDLANSNRFSSGNPMAGNAGVHWNGGLTRR